MRATKAVVIKVQTAREKVQSTKVKNATIVRDNAKTTFIKTTHKNRELNKIPDIDITT